MCLAENQGTTGLHRAQVTQPDLWDGRCSPEDVLTSRKASDGGQVQRVRGAEANHMLRPAWPRCRGEAPSASLPRSRAGPHWWQITLKENCTRMSRHKGSQETQAPGATPRPLVLPVELQELLLGRRVLRSGDHPPGDHSCYPHPRQRPTTYPSAEATKSRLQQPLLGVGFDTEERLAKNDSSQIKRIHLGKPLSKYHSTEASAEACGTSSGKAARGWSGVEARRHDAGVLPEGHVPQSCPLAVLTRGRHRC